MATDATGTPTPLGIPKLNTSADAPSGLGFNAAMDAIDALINAHTGVNAAGTSILVNKLLSADAQPAFQLRGDGQIGWGLGGASAIDTNLYRSVAGRLKTDGDFLAGGSVYVGSSADTLIYRKVANQLGTVGSFVSEGALSAWGFIALATGDTVARSYLRNDGQLLFGPGNAAQDVNLYRSSALNLKTDSSFTVGNSLVVGTGDPNAKVYFGAALDTNLYRSGAGILSTDGLFASLPGYALGTDTNTSLRIRKGSVIVAIDGSFNGSVTYASAFPTATDNVVLTNGDRSAGGDWYGTVITPSASGFTFKAMSANSGGINVRLNYIAIGH